MKKQENLKVEDLATDLDFIRWVKNPTEEDEVYWSNWIEKNPNQREKLKEARKLVLSILDQKMDSTFSLQDFQEVKENIRNHIHSNPSTVSLPYVRWAASILLVLSFAFFLWEINRDQATISYHTAYGETREIILPDRSIILLNANSHLTTPENWNNAKKREIWLDGEAYFKVKEIVDNSFPAEFQVHTGNGLDIRVLGTEFNVNDRHQQAEVVLTSGKVQLNSRQQRLLMAPGEAITYSGNHQKFRKKDVNVDQYLSWTNNQLVFDNTPLAELRQKVDDLFGIRLQFEVPDFDKRKFTGSAPYNNLEILYLSIARTFDLEYQQTDNAIIFRKSG